VHDPAGAVRGRIPGTVRVEEFPPRAVVEQADPSRQQACFVIPVRGAGGDHGFLALVGPVDSSPGSGRATYNHWAALLGVALKQQSLLEEVRRSEERYSLAAAATEDGLWDWDVERGSCFFSERAAAMLAAGPAGGAGPADGAPPELATWTRAVHPDDRPRLVAALRGALADSRPFEVEHRIRTDDGTYRWVVCRGLPVDGSRRRAPRRVVGSLVDIHAHKELEEQLRRGALHDSLTGLPNRPHFLERLTTALDDLAGNGGPGFTVVFLDLDGFKLVNDSLGHLMGDELLTVIADRLVHDLRPVDTAARFGGDEFAVLLRGLSHEAVLRVVGRIQQRVAEPVLLRGQEVCVTASVGIAPSVTGYTDPEDVLRDADIAMYHAKGSERGTTSVFEPAMHARATGRLQAQSELRTALLEGQFEVHYQPLVSLDGAALTQFEALVRWRHPQRGVVLPGEFLPVMIESGTVVALGHWVIDSVCRQVAEWAAAGRGPVEVSVNVSHAEFWSDRLLGAVTDALDKHGVAAHSLVLEITESVIMSDPDAARTIMRNLQQAGVRLHIDDFGTGHSSLHALRAFPVDALKIDQSFVQQLGIDAQTTELVRIIVAMGQVLGIHVVAEGVETTLQADTLRDMGCGTAQGWLYARAVPGAEAAELLGTYLADTLDRELDDAASMSACLPTSGTS
jgi:diguanylate cyclase (GGDEF)-like protein